MPASLTTIIVLVVWIVVAVVLLRLYQGWASKQRSRERLFAEDPRRAEPPKPRQPGQIQGSLHRWLYLAGYRDPSAPALFILTTLFLALVGLGLAFLLSTSGTLDRGRAMLEAFPGGVLDIFVPIFLAAPYLLFLIIALIPFVIVRAARRERVVKIEQDLPLALELLATLTEAGLGFDAALDRLIKSQSTERPLIAEFRTFQMETLSGRSRVSCFRRLARRIDVPSVNAFVSAIVQAEQSGAGIATTMRHQADDLRSVRRERALEFSMSLPVKRLVPMVVCFLPGIFVAALGPPFTRLLTQMGTQVITGGGS